MFFKKKEEAKYLIEYDSEYVKSSTLPKDKNVILVISRVLTTEGGHLIIHKYN